MESYRQGHRLMVSVHRQSGITVIGFLMLATLFGIVGLAGMKLVPMYIQNLRLSTILEDLKTELDGKATTPQTIQRDLDRRLAVEGISLPRQNVKIAQGKNGYEVRIQYENRAPYVADIYLMLAFDRQIEIRR